MKKTYFLHLFLFFATSLSPSLEGQNTLVRCGFPDVKNIISALVNGPSENPKECMQGCIEEGVSLRYDLKKEEPDNFWIGFINGIMNDFEKAKKSADYVSKLSGDYNVHGVYNASCGIYHDLSECLLGFNHIKTTPVCNLQEMWDDFFEQAGCNDWMLMVCHSQGALHLRNALNSYPEERVKRISIIAVAPAAYFDPNKYRSVVHLVAHRTRDIVPRMDLSGRKRAGNTVIELASEEEAGLFDHSFLSSTYFNSLRKRILELINKTSEIKSESK